MKRSREKTQAQQAGSRGCAGLRSYGGNDRGDGGLLARSAGAWRPRVGWRSHQRAGLSRLWRHGAGRGFSWGWVPTLPRGTAGGRDVPGRPGRAAGREVSCPKQASPALRLSETTIGPVSIMAGQNGPARSVEFTNAGDGTLNVTLRSSETWAAPSMGASRPCSVFGTGSGNCMSVTVVICTVSPER